MASGAAGALPHAEPRREPIAPGSMVTIDIGAVLDGYHSDCTRTLATGPVPDPLGEVYELVRKAQLAGLDAVRPGVTGKDADAVVRALITEAGHGEHFMHRTGHGIGLEEHEDPYIVAGNREPLEPGMTFSVEPGIYLPGRFGARIEDIVTCTDQGSRRLNLTSRDLRVVPA